MPTSYKIEKIPVPRLHGRGAPVYPFSELVIGESFLVKGSAAKIASARNCAYSFQRSHPEIKIISKMEKGGVRFWRVENEPTRRKSSAKKV